MTEPSAPPRVVLSFGRFELLPSERLLIADGAPVEIGARTLDTLIALASRPNEPVGKRDLMAQVWPDVTVEEGSLRFHIAALRKALGDGKNGARYISTLAGRGYCFVAPVTRGATPAAKTGAAETTSPRRSFLPHRLARLVGRDKEIQAVAAELAASRFVSIIGPGGVGKTTVAVAVAHELLRDFDGAVLFVDFGLLSDPRMAPSSVASMMGLSIQSDDPLPSLIGLLNNRRMLLVFDTCEHVVEEAARLSERLYLAAPQLHILTTSREALRVEGEHVHRLAPLGVPPDDPALSASDTLAFPAARLFLERANASGARLDLADANAAIVASICRKLDGMALAIELAAGRVAAYGLDQTAAMIDQRFTLLWPGQRNAPARQKTLQATLEWSYGLLSESERIVFRRLGVFVGPFTIEAALQVVTDEVIDAAWVFAAIDSLVAKSMVAAFPSGGTLRYRLLDITRAYVLATALEANELAPLAERHAAYCQTWLERTATAWPALSNATHWVAIVADLNGVRAALEWCFGSAGKLDIGVDLAAAAAPVFFAMSMLTECQRWSQRAILALDDASRGGRKEMRLQAALALSSMWTQGNSETTSAALNRSIALAERLEDRLNHIILLAPLHVYHLCAAEFEQAMRYAIQVAELSRRSQDLQAVRLAHILLGYSLHFAGDLAPARRELEAALSSSAGKHGVLEMEPSPSTTIQNDAMGAPILALASSAAPSALARTLWLQGDSAAALEYVHRTLATASDSNHPVALLVALLYAISVLIWNGDLDEAEAQIARLVANAETYSLATYVLLGRCFEGQLAINRGDMERGIERLQPSMRALRALRYDLLTTSFNISLVQAFMAAGRLEEGVALLDGAIRSVETNGDHCYMPELLRAKAELLLALPEPQTATADACLTESLAVSRRQGALAWELRTSIDLAKRLAAQGRRRQARARLQPVVDRFVTTTASADARTARGLLARWD